MRRYPTLRRFVHRLLPVMRLVELSFLWMNAVGGAFLMLLAWIDRLFVRVPRFRPGEDAGFAWIVLVSVAAIILFSALPPIPDDVDCDSSG